MTTSMPLNPSLQQLRRGAVITAVPTVFTDAGDLDEPGTRRLFEWLASSGVDAAFVAGTTGEFTTLDDDERLRVIDIGLDVFGPERTIAHVGAADRRRAETLAARAYGRGAVRFAAITPYFLPAPPEAVLEYAGAIMQAAPGCELYAYLFRARSTTDVAPADLGALAAAGLAGVKISGEDLPTVQRYLAEAPAGFAVYSGDDRSYPSLLGAGGAGVVSGVSSAFPEAFVRLREAVRSGEDGAVSEAQRDVERVVDLVRSGSLTHLKAALGARGLPSGPVRAAVAAVPSADAEALREEAGRWAT